MRTWMHVLNFQFLSFDLSKEGKVFGYHKLVK